MSQLARDRPGEEPAAHPDLTMDAPAFDRHACFHERLLPGKDMSIDGIDQRAVQIKDKCLHSFLQKDVALRNASLCLPGWLASRSVPRAVPRTRAAARSNGS